MYPNGQYPIGYTGTSDVARGQAQIVPAFGTTLWQVTLNGSGVGTWDSSVTGPSGGVGNGVKQFLSSIRRGALSQHRVDLRGGETSSLPEVRPTWARYCAE